MNTSISHPATVDGALATAYLAAIGQVNVVRGTNSSLPGKKRIKIRTQDQGFFTFDQATQDAAGVFLIGELERLDQRLHMPLAAVTWGRDIDLRQDVSMADEFSSFTNSTFSQPPGVAGSNIAWAGKDSNAIVGIGLDIGKTILPLNIWATQLSWTLPELASAQKLGRPIDQQKYEMMQLKYQMDVDQVVYVGDSAISTTGLFNQTGLTNTGNATNGSWATATPTQILADVDNLLYSVWKATGFAIIPDRLLVDPTSYGILVSTLVSTAGNISVLEFLKKNSLANANAGKELNIQPCKWLLGTNNGNTKGVAATNSMFAYVKDPMRVRMPLVPIQRTPMEYRDLRQLVTYFARIGAIEMVYPEVCGLRSNLG
jgi:hypothetical protein